MVYLVPSNLGERLVTIFPKKFTQGSVQIGIQTHSNCRQNKNNSRMLKYLGILSSKYRFPNHKPFAQTISKKNSKLNFPPLPDCMLRGYKHGQKQLRHSPTPPTSKKICFIECMSFSISNFHIFNSSSLLKL